MLRAFVVLLAALALPAVAPAQADSTTAPDPIAQLVARLDLERDKATIKGLTNFGDRRQGTDRNRAAVDWIEAQLRSYGCSNVARLKYDYQPPSSPSPGGRGGQGVRPPAGGGRYRGIRAQTGVNTDSLKQPDADCARSTHRPARRASAKRCTAPRSARRTPGRCTSSAATWTGSGGARPRTMTARGPRSSWSWPASSPDRTCAPIARSGSFCGTTRRPASTARAPTSSSAARSRARATSPSGSA